jgi:hypothetical protein
MIHNRRLKAVLAVVCALNFFNVDVTYGATVQYKDFSREYFGTDHQLHDLPGFLDLKRRDTDGDIIRLKIPIGGSVTLGEPFEVFKQEMDVNGSFVPVTPKPHVKLSIRRFVAIKQYPVLMGAAFLGQRKRVMLNYPPAGTVWHIPGGVSQLTSLLRADGHEVVQRYGHTIGLEHVLLSHSEMDVSKALTKVRDPTATIEELYESRLTFERVSSSIPTKDRFRVERNNVVYQSQYQDGTIRGALNALADRESNLWHKYFREVEVPVAVNFNPHVYGVSIGDERQLYPGLILASMVKDALPNCVVIVGGNFFGRIPDPAGYPDFVELFNHLDGIVYAEGFQPLQHIVNTLDVSTATGTIWKNGNVVVKNPRTENPTEFESLPAPEFDGGAAQWAPEVIPTLYTQSHCPFACEFCAIALASDTAAAGRLDDQPKAKPRSICPRQIVLNMQSTGARKFDITDELFSIAHQLELGRELRKIGYDATWQCYLTVTVHLMDPKVCQDLYAAGCRSVQLGLETLCEKTLFEIDKKWNTPKNYDRILKNFRDAGIHTHAFLMVGLPKEPLYEGLRWVGFMQKHSRNILTIKSGRWRPARYSPEVERGLLDAHVELYPDTKPFQTNRSFRYRSATHSNTKVDAVRDIVEQACHRHWAYSVTSTVPWWINRSRYTWEQLEDMAKALPPEPDIPHLDDRIAQMRYLVRTELKQDASFRTWDELTQFAQTLL